MPSAEKVRTRGKMAMLSQPTGTASAITSTAVTPGSRRSLPGTKPTSTTGLADSGSMAKLLDRFNTLELAINGYKDNTDTLAAQTNKELADIKGLLQATRDESVMEHRKFLIMEQNLKAVNTLNDRLSDRLNAMENNNKLCNIRIDGKSEVEGEDLKAYVNDLAKFLNPNSQRGPDLASVYRIGKKPTFAGVASNNGRHMPRPRTIMVVFASAADRNTFYYARTKLKGAQNYVNIYLNDDVSVFTRKAREDYRSVAALARLKGADVRIHGDGVILDGTKYKINEPETLPECYSLARAKTMEFGGEIFFQSHHSYLSNFYGAPILVNDKIYPSAEHLYQHEKCEAAGNTTGMNLIHNAITPLDAKRIGDTVTETADWRQNKETVMTNIVNLKFDQNPPLARLLLETGDKVLNEATNNMYFGIGATLHSREIKDKSYKGLNKLGQILMNKRQQLLTNKQEI